MKMMDAVKHVFSNYAVFSGRARRSEYWYFVLFSMIVSAVLSRIGKEVPMEVAGQVVMVTQSKLLSIYNLVVFIPTLAVVVRRLHDVGKSGWNYFWFFLPIIGWIMMLVWLCREGEHGPNRFGPDPKEPAYGPAPWEY